jgi:DNA-binding LacI/PurR family transcriptional regulator
MPAPPRTVEPPRQATIREVAHSAGVSVATVSRVLNASGQVSAHAEQAVRQAAAALGFRPNLLGRSLRGVRTRTFGVMLPTLLHPVFAECLQGIESATQSQGYAITLGTTGYRAEAEESVSERLLQQRVDGLILTVADALRSPLLDKLDAEGVPYVLAFNQIGRRRAAGKVRPSVCVDNRKAAHQMVEHLIDLGHRRIQLVVGQFSQSDRSRHRFAGYQAAMASSGLPAKDPLELPFDSTDVRAQLQDLLSRRDAPSAVFCSNDQLAMTVIRDLRRLGVRVPEDVSVAGFDGVRVGEWMSPVLTTVVQPIADIGRTAVDLLLQIAAGEVCLGPATLHHTLRLGGTAQRCVS